MISKKHILVVDDVTTNLRYIGEVLKDDYSLSMARSGEQALKMLEKNVPDLILLDLKMPGMDGFKLLSSIKEDERFKDVAVFILTADNQDESMNKALSMGAVDFIKKPFTPGDMLERINKVLG